MTTLMAIPDVTETLEAATRRATEQRPITRAELVVAVEREIGGHTADLLNLHARIGRHRKGAADLAERIGRLNAEIENMAAWLARQREAKRTGDDE